jgi:hypothetical protein
VLVAQHLQLPAGLPRLGVEGGTFADVDPDRPTTPPDQRDAEAEGRSIDGADATNGAFRDGAHGVGWLLAATCCGHGLWCSHGEFFLCVV